MTDGMLFGLSAPWSSAPFPMGQRAPLVSRPSGTALISFRVCPHGNEKLTAGPCQLPPAHRPWAQGPCNLVVGVWVRLGPGCGTPCGGGYGLLLSPHVDGAVKHPLGLNLASLSQVIRAGHRCLAAVWTYRRDPSMLPPITGSATPPKSSGTRAPAPQQCRQRDESTMPRKPPGMREAGSLAPGTAARSQGT